MLIENNYSVGFINPALSRVCSTRLRRDMSLDLMSCCSGLKWNILTVLSEQWENVNGPKGWVLLTNPLMSHLGSPQAFLALSQVSGKLSGKLLCRHLWTAEDKDYISMSAFYWGVLFNLLRMVLSILIEFRGGFVVCTFGVCPSRAGRRRALQRYNCVDHPFFLFPYDYFHILSLSSNILTDPVRNDCFKLPEAKAASPSYRHWPTEENHISCSLKQLVLFCLQFGCCLWGV